MAEKITNAQKGLLIKLGYSAPKPIDQLTRVEATVCINSRMATIRSQNTTANRRGGAGLIRGGFNI